MSELFHPLLQAYAEQYSSAPDDLLREQEAYTRANHPKAHMHSGALQGMFLRFFSMACRPSRILDIGTFTGYSALCLAEGLQPGGMLHTIECRAEDAAIAEGYFNRSANRHMICQHTGNALEIIPQIQESWDLVFIDADKVSYIQYYELTLPYLKPGGFILADNVLFHGQVLENPPSGKNAVAIQAFNAHVAGDDRVEQVLLTMRDGLMLIRKK